MGTSIILYNLRYYTEDHPHAYGDKSPMTAQRAGGQKSSPRVWGQVLSVTHRAVSRGIIPTRMGTSCWGCGSGSKGRDHPHAYGDKLSKSAPTAQSLGSSPRVWGQGYHSTAVGVSERIIPTRMGTSLLCQCPPLYIRDHPHAYGDKSGNVGFIALAQRSSPRVWGQEF